jgi:hypothetical protein
MIDVMEKIKEFGELYKNGEYSKCLDEISSYWNTLPEPKEEIPNSYLLIEYGARVSLVKKEFDRAWDWALLSLNYNEIRNKMGEGEFLLGKVAFEKNDLDNAKKYFLIAYDKSEGRAFEGEDPRYKKLIGKKK